MKKNKLQKKRFDYQGEVYNVNKTYTPKVIQEFVKIQKTIGLTPENLLKKAKNKNSPLHKFFEWDNSKAGEQYRLHQAVTIVNEVKVEIKGKMVPWVESVSIRVRGDGFRREYRPAKEIISNEKLRKQIIQTALSYLETWKTKFEFYSELLPIVKSIDRTKKRLSKKWGK